MHRINIFLRYLSLVYAMGYVWCFEDKKYSYRTRIVTLGYQLPMQFLEYDVVRALFIQ